MKFSKNLFLLSFLLLINSIVYSQEVGYKETQLTQDSDNRFASYNKDGTKIIFETNRDGHWQIYTMNIGGDRQKRLIKSNSNDRRPTWHPYKDIILFESDRTGQSEIYKYDLDTRKTSVILLSLHGNKTHAQFAPNGVEYIFNLEDTKNDFDIYIAHSKGKKPKKIVDDAFMNLNPRYSPRGDNILYSSNKNNERETDVIYLYNYITNERSRLSYFKDHSFNPNWSFDGREVAYAASIKDETSEIFTMRNDGIDKKQITFNNTEDILPSWSPNGQNLLVTRNLKGKNQIVRVFLSHPLEEE
jgi:TolB protein